MGLRSKENILDANSMAPFRLEMKHSLVPIVLCKENSREGAHFENPPTEKVFNGEKSCRACSAVRRGGKFITTILRY